MVTVSGDALPDTSRPLTDDERERLACDWSDYRGDYGIASFTTREGRVAYYGFVAGWTARNAVTYAGEHTYSEEPSVAVRTEMRDTQPATFAILREARVVARGIEFADGTTAIRWIGETASTVVWSNLNDALTVPGTELIWDRSNTKSGGPS